MWDTITQTCEYYNSPNFIGCGLDKSPFKSVDMDK